MLLHGKSVRVVLMMVIAVASAGCVSEQARAAAAGPPKTLAYDGFATGGNGGTYRNHIRLVASAGAVAETIGFASSPGWGGSTSHFHTRFGRKLTHNFLKKTAPGSLGHWTFNGHRAVGRKLPGAPAAKSGVYTLCLLYKAHENRATKTKAKDGHTTNFAGCYGMMGFVPGTPAINRGARGGNNGAKGLSIGYFEDDLRVFAGGKSFTIIEQYKLGVTYLLMAEMTVNKDGPEHIKGFYAADGDKKLTPAKFNAENGGKGAKIETWASASDVIRLQIYTKDFAGLAWPPQASGSDSRKDDFITWDEVRLMDGKATVPVPHIPAKGAFVPEKKLLVAKKTLPAKLAAYWAFDEGQGKTARDAAGKAHGKLLRAQWITDGVLGKALHFTAKIGPKYGPHSSSMVSIPHKTAVDAGLPWERYHKFTYTAWARGGNDFKSGSDIITKANSGRAEERRFADIKGIAFMVSGNKLELELINSINFPQPDMRIKVRSKLDVPGDKKWHHVAVTYDGSSKPSGVTFYVDGVKGDGFSFNFANLPRQPKVLTGDVGVLSPYCIGGRDCVKEKDGVTALAAGYAMAGDIDEAGIFSYVLGPGHVIAIHGLATAGGLKYNLKQVNQLIELHRAKAGSAKIGDKTWEYAGSGLKGGLGKVAKDGDNFAVQLGADGSGVRTK